MIHEDYERDYLKDIMYLQERVATLEQLALELYEDTQRFDAKIFIEKQKSSVENEHTADTLPF